MDKNDAYHPYRIKAIRILEAIAERVGKEELFDCSPKDDTRWYDLEDLVTDIISKTWRGEELIPVYASCHGDRTVGIWGDLSEMAIESRFIGEASGYGEENRKWLKSELTKIWTELFDEPAYIHFEDECPDCGRLQTKCLCKEYFDDN